MVTILTWSRMGMRAYLKRAADDPSSTALHPSLGSLARQRLAGENRPTQLMSGMGSGLMYLGVWIRVQAWSIAKQSLSAG
jgi:hypothetical protein